MANEAEVDGEIDVAKIMERIRENIQKRKGIVTGTGNETGAPTDVERDLNYINSNWNIENNSYYISSHRRITGKFLVTGRELVQGEVRRYVDPVFWKQKEFNASIVRILNDITRKIDEITRKTTELEEKIGQVRSEIAGEVANRIEDTRNEIDGQITRKTTELEEKIGQVRSEIAGEVGRQIRGEVTEQLQSALLAMDTDIENWAWLVKALEGRALRGAPDEIEFSNSPSEGTGLNYFVFEDRFRGSREDIKGRQKEFVRYFEGCNNVLDIGCGRGEFLELMRDAGIGGRGVDLDETMVEFCRSRGLEVELNDAVSYLEQLDDKSLDGVFIDQVVEHLEPAYLIRLLKLCYQKLKFGYYLIAETVNPLSFVSFANFYIDPTHVRPVHPEALKFLFGAAGFREIETQFSAPVSDEARLRKLPLEEVTDEGKKALFESYNCNIELLNGTLYGAQDYAMVGKK